MCAASVRLLCMWIDSVHVSHETGHAGLGGLTGGSYFEFHLPGPFQ
jgi:hypothetical protein